MSDNDFFRLFGFLLLAGVQALLIIYLVVVVWRGFGRLGKVIVLFFAVAFLVSSVYLSAALTNFYKAPQSPTATPIYVIVTATPEEARP